MVSSLTPIENTSSVVVGPCEPGFARATPRTEQRAASGERRAASIRSIPAPPCPVYRPPGVTGSATYGGPREVDDPLLELVGGKRRHVHSAEARSRSRRLGGHGRRQGGAARLASRKRSLLRRVVRWARGVLRRKRGATHQPSGSSAAQADASWGNGGPRAWRCAERSRLLRTSMISGGRTTA